MSDGLFGGNVNCLAEILGNVIYVQCLAEILLSLGKNVRCQTKRKFKVAYCGSPRKRTNRLERGKRARDEPTIDTEHSSPMYSMAFRVGVIEKRTSDETTSDTEHSSPMFSMILRVVGWRCELEALPHIYVASVGGISRKKENETTDDSTKLADVQAIRQYSLIIYFRPSSTETSSTSSASR
jgi:hypothetical protein